MLPSPARNSLRPTNTAPVIPLGGTAPGSLRTALIGAWAGAAFAADTSLVRYASRSFPLLVQMSFPFGEVSAHMAFGISAGSSFT